MTLCKVTAHNQLYKSKRLGVVDGLLSNAITDIKQDANGYMWFGTTNGISRYDGYVFENYQTFSLSSIIPGNNFILNITNDEGNGVVWVESYNGDVFCFDIKANRFVDYGCNGKKLNSGPFLTSHGTWFCNDTAGFVCVLRQGDKLLTKTLKMATSASAVLEDNTHHVWLITEKNIYIHIENNKVRQLLTGKKILAADIWNDCLLVITDDDNVYRLKADDIYPYELCKIDGMTGLSDHIVWKNQLLLFTTDGTISIDLKTGNVTRPLFFNIPNGKLQARLPGYQFVANASGTLWMFPDNGTIQRLDLISESRLTQRREHLYHIDCSSDGRLFIGTYGNGLYVIDPMTGSQTHMMEGKMDSPLCSDFIVNVCVDFTDNVWVGTESAGISCLSSVQDGVSQHVMILEQETDRLSNVIKRVFAIGKDSILVSTRDYKLFCYEPESQRITLLNQYQSGVYAYLRDRNGNTWIGTKGDGLYLNGEHIVPKIGSSQVVADKIYDMVEDRQGRIWMSISGFGLVVAQIGEPGLQPVFIQLKDEILCTSHIWELCLDSEGILWMATDKGLFGLNTCAEQLDSSALLHYNAQNSMLPGDKVVSVLCDKRNNTAIQFGATKNLWFSVSGFGLLKGQIGRNGKMNCQFINMQMGLANNIVRSIEQDSYGWIWVSTEEGIARISPESNVVHNIIFNASLAANIYSENCSACMPDGRMVYGSNMGMDIVSPLPPSFQQQPELKITDLKINQHSIFTSDDTTQANDFNRGRHLFLESDQNELSFYFSTFDYTFTQSILYQYYLEGYEEDWQTPMNLNHAEYTELSPGTYIFHLRVQNADGEWSGEQICSITIHQPWYNTWYSWLFYIIMVSVVGWYLYRSWRQNFQLHQQMKVEKCLNEFRINFFTHIAHEFRTPLSLIDGAVRNMSQARDGIVAHQDLQTARRGNLRLSRLVNQLMDFRRLSTNNFRLSVERADLIDFVRIIYQTFWTIAVQKQLNYTFFPFANHYTVLFDKHMMETMVSNLISNAVKYTPEQGTVSLKINLSEQQNEVRIIIVDNGPGISEQQEKFLFRPFMHGYVTQGGMGIGLYNAYNMALLHHGSLTYSAPKVGTGTVFTLIIPTDEKVYTDADLCTEAIVDTHISESKQTDDIICEMVSPALNEQCIAVIEDDPDMMQQIRQEIGFYFNIKGYMNGQTGYDGVRTDCPSLIICDVMLPDMDGYEIVTRLKKDADMCHIPIIMLTALDDEEHQLKGYKVGADDYVTKPCNYRLLVARCIRLIKWSKLSKENTDITETASAPGILTNRLDKLLKERIEQIVSSNLGNANLNVDFIANALSIGRTKLFGKTKDLFGVTPNAYILDCRLRAAAELLRDGTMSVSEIAFKVGFQSASYFYRCFKDKYGIAPSKFAEVESES